MSSNILEVKDRVQRYLSEMLSRFDVDDKGRFSFRFGSSRIFLSVLDLKNGDIVVRIDSPVLLEVPLSPELYKYIALHSDDYIFGHLSLSERNDLGLVMLSHTLLGDYLDAEELHSAVGAVAGTADSMDDELQEVFGGRRFHEED